MTDSRTGGARALRLQSARNAVNGDGHHRGRSLDSANRSRSVGACGRAPRTRASCSCTAWIRGGPSRDYPISSSGRRAFDERRRAEWSRCRCGVAEDRCHAAILRDDQGRRGPHHHSSRPSGRGTAARRTPGRRRLPDGRSDDRASGELCTSTPTTHSISSWSGLPTAASSCPSSVARKCAAWRVFITADDLTRFVRGRRGTSASRPE